MPRGRRRPSRAVPLLFALLLAPCAFAAPGGAPRASANAPVAAAAAVPATPSDSLAALPAPPARDYLAEARAGYGPVSRAYNGTRIVLHLFGPVYGIVCGLLLMFTGLSARFRDVAVGLGHRRYVRVLVYFTLYSAAMFVLGLPLSWYEEF